jgi:hypothetical protein
MAAPCILPIDPATPLSEIIRVAPPAEPCGVWIAGPGAREPMARLGAVPAGGSLLVRSDLGALLRSVRVVVVSFEGRLAAMPSTVLSLARMLEIVTDGPRLVVPLRERGPEEVLVETRAGGRRVAASRIRYAGVDVRPGRPLG